MTLETFLSRHSEAAVAGILENWERYTGRQAPAVISLEERWKMFMDETPNMSRSAMA